MNFEDLNKHEYSILIPTWNNLEYLKLCIESIREYSDAPHQILVFVNQGHDGTKEWLDEFGIDYIHSERNVGICYALNELAALATKDFIVYMNDDMVVLPEWDTGFAKTISNYDNDLFFLSSTLIEPYESNNPNLPVIVRNFGEEYNHIDFEEMLSCYKNLKKDDWLGSSWPVSIVSRRLWNVVGGYSIEFSPGFYSDPDFSMKLWKYGVREFRGLGNSLVYHFGSKSTKRVESKINARKVFMRKWGMSANFFYHKYLRMGEKYDGKLKEPSISTFEKMKNRYKQMMA